MQIKTAAFSNCSNAVYRSAAELAPLKAVFAQAQIEVKNGACLFEDPTMPHFTGTAQARAAALTALYADRHVDAIFDISGGDAANGILADLDYTVIAENPKPLFGYSDMTCVLNAIYAKTGMETYLYQVRNLTGPCARVQQARFFASLQAQAGELFDFSYRFLSAEKRMHGIVVGGNMRCFLKLAGTPYFPDCTDKIVFLESYGGRVERLYAYFCQLQQMGVFQQCRGVLLGTCTQADREDGRENVVRLAQQFVLNRAFAVTDAIGHGPDARCLAIGRAYSFE